MDWIRSHPYMASLAGACILVLIGTILVLRGATQPTPVGVSAWNGNPGTIISPETTPNSQTNPTNTTNNNGTVTTPTTQQNYATTTLPYKPIPPASSRGKQGIANASFDYDTLLAEISAQSNTNHSSTKNPTPNTTANSNNTVNAWDFIPSGLISTTSPSSGRSASQQALYLYGNEVGSYVEGYDAENRNQVQVLSDAMNDRQNPTKSAAVERIGRELQTVGSGIAETTDVPKTAQAANTALANSYIQIGKDLVVVGQSEALSDSALVSAIEIYDAAVNNFNKSYIALATLFSINGVTFGAGDPGSVFSFTSTSNSL